MSPRMLIAAVAAIVVSVSLAAIAAVPGFRQVTTTVTPEIHREGDEGYFRIVVSLPKGAPQGAVVLVPQINEGDVFLVHASAPLSSGIEDDGDAEEGPPEGQITVTGRFVRPGPARLTILARPAGKPLKSLVTLAFKLPSGESQNPEVRRAWAQQQQMALAGADPGGDDSFSHYWNLAVAPRYGLSPLASEGSERFRREPPDLYSVFTGAAAIQESLQLELLGSGPQSPAQREAIRKARNAPDDPVPLASLAGPAVKSHPFREMLKGRDPQLPPLAAFIPADQYAVFFGNINREIELADLMDEWGGNLLRQMEAEARDFKVREKVSRQLCLENSWLTRMFGDRVVGSMAFTGADPFLKEGTDFTVLFCLRDRERFRKQLEKRYAEGAERGAVRSSFTVAGKQGFAVVSPDRRVSSYALIMDDVAVVSTSRAALERVVAVNEKHLPSLAQADDFRYMRTIFPENAAEEDIFIYLSDPHIRSLVGPRWKIGEARRMRCAGNMALIANARLWFRSEKRHEPTMAELVAGGYLGKTPPVCPDHGAYAIDKQGEVFCSQHNRPGLLTPVGEVPLDAVTPGEAAEYTAFVENYNRYWTRFFDPIGIRVKMGDTIRVQTCILPLIENSWYDGLAAFSGRTPGSVSESAVLPRTVISLRGHMAPEWLGKTGLVRHLTEHNRLNLDWLGDEVALNLCDGQVLFSAGGRAMGLLGQDLGRGSLEPIVIGYLASALNLPTYLTVKVNDPRTAEASIPALFRALGPEHSRDGEFAVDTYTIEDHGGKPLYVANFTLWVVKLRLYAAVVDDRLVIASRRNVVTDLLDGKAKNREPAEQEGNMELSVYRSAFRELAENVNLGWQEDLRHACEKNLPLAAILLKNLEMPAKSLSAATFALRGYEPYCPSGGRYVLDEKSGAVVCTVHGNRWHPRQPDATDHSSPTMKLVNSLEKVNARLAFTPEGLMTTLEIKRKPSP
jgi:hypothetical protein